MKGVWPMERNNFTFDTKKVSDFLRNELFEMSKQDLKNAPSEVQPKNLQEIEFISKKDEEISPILKMNEDQVLAFVEAFDVSMLSTLSVQELNYIGEKLGVEPKILFGLSD